MDALDHPFTLRGLRLYGYPKGDYLSDYYRANNDFFEADILDDLRGRVSGGTMVDAGAMIGNHSLYFSEFLGADQVWAFEPWPDNFERLCRAAAMFPNIFPHEVALSDHVGTERFIVPKEVNRGHGRITGMASTAPTIDVAVTKLDDYYLNDVRLLKIDVERHEPQVLAGARETIELYHPLILVEDWEQSYGPLLPDYHVLVAWPAHATYLYEWNA